MRTHQTAEQLNQHWHGAGGHWLGAFSQDYRAPREGDATHSAVDDLAIDDVNHAQLYLGEVTTLIFLTLTTFVFEMKHLYYPLHSFACDWMKELLNYLCGIESIICTCRDHRHELLSLF